MQKKLNIVAIETFYGGSHQIFIDGLIKHSAHEISLISLAATNWRWRMKLGAVQIFAEKGANYFKNFDLIFCTSLCNISELRALIGNACPPIVLYAHENQHTYPKSYTMKKDFQLEWIDFVNTLSADAVVYNSDFHRNSYHQAIKAYMQNLPHTTLDAEKYLTQLQNKSSILYPGIDIADTFVQLTTNKQADKIPRILWNHRWEYDKQPMLFLKTLLRCMQAGVDFELILLGEPPLSDRYTKLLQQLQTRIVHQGFVPSRHAYFALLNSADIVISTAIQENFGLSVVEAIACGCFPILPKRLSYPELIPVTYHSQVLYASDEDFYQHVLTTLINKSYLDSVALAQHFRRHSWSQRIAEYDDFFTSVLR